MKWLKSLMIIAAFRGLASADTIHIPEDYPSIQLGLYVASSGDTILVAPGTYTGFVWSGIMLMDIHIIGAGAFGDSVSTLANDGSIYLDDAHGWEIAGFEITGCYTGIYTEYCSDLDIHHNYIHNLNEGYSYATLIEFCDDLYIHHNVFAYISYVAVRLTGVENVVYYNNDVMHTNSYHGFLIDDNHYGLQIINNIIAFNDDDGIQFVVGQGDAILNYNDNYGNGCNWNNCSPGIGCISLDPQFTGSPACQYTLRRSSPCIDAGDPAYPPDPDGTRCDIGAYYFDQTPPTIQELCITVEEDGVVLQWPPFTIVTSYNIYRSTEPYFNIGGMTPIATVTEPEFTDENALTQNRFFYVVTCITND